ncbi:MAG TPA: DUF4142 domain-containing protein [Candidatus Udaeobacter sp.]
MKPKLISLSAIVALAIAASSICVIETVRAYTNAGQPATRPAENYAQARDIMLTQIDTGIGTNPHLRSQSQGAAASPGTTTVKMSQKDVSFIQKAAGNGQQEVENGKMAQKQGKSADVRNVAARIVADHTRINKELTALAARKGVTFNTSGVKAQNLGSADFDKTYLKLLEETHKIDIADFERAAKSGDDSELKSWASKTVPTLKQHLSMVQQAEKQAGVR